MWKALCGIALVATLAGCAQDDSEPDAPPDATSTATASAESQTPSVSGSPAATSGGGSTAERALDIEQRHPNGSVLRVRGITIEPTSITLQVEVINGYEQAIALGFSGNTVRLEDNEGRTFEFVPPPQNEDLDIQQRGTLTGDLVFYGVLDEGATFLRLQTNVSPTGPGQSINVAGESATDTFPKFSVEIPLER